jgi:DNA-binding NtrC family response regulator
MKKILFYSHDFSFCMNLLLYLQHDYLVTTTTDVEHLRSLVKNAEVDLLLIDSEPNAILQEFLQQLREFNDTLPVILTYVYKQKINEMESEVRPYVNSIFYKPYDLNEVTKQLIDLTLK